MLASPATRRSCGLACLLLCLAGLTHWGCFLAIHAPYQHSTYWSCQIDPEQSVAILSQSSDSETQSNVLTWTKTTALDLDSGKLWYPANERFAYFYDHRQNGRLHWIVEKANVGIWDISDPRDVRWVVTDLKSGRTLKSVPYDLHSWRRPAAVSWAIPRDQATRRN